VRTGDDLTFRVPVNTADQLGVFTKSIDKLEVFARDFVDLQLVGVGTQSNLSAVWTPDVTRDWGVAEVEGIGHVIWPFWDRKVGGERTFGQG
jgi:hypothetical protein